MVKTRAKQRQSIQPPSLCPAAPEPCTSVLDLEDVLAASPAAPRPSTGFNVYDLGPGGCPRNLTGSPVEFARLKQRSEGFEERFTVFRQYIQFRMLQKSRPRAYPQPIKPRICPKSRYLDLYRVLGVRANCSDSSLRQAYKRRALKTHPDKGGNSWRFDQVRAAYDVLSKPELRETYNENGFSGLEALDPAFDASKFLRKLL